MLEFFDYVSNNQTDLFLLYLIDFQFAVISCARNLSSNEIEISGEYEFSQYSAPQHRPS